MKTRMSIMAAIVACSAPALADGEGIPVEPGLWHITTTMNMPMMAQPQTMTVEECYDDEVLDMDDMSTGELDPGCSHTLDRVDGKTMKWSIDCPVEGGGRMHAEWLAISSGESVEGEGQMTMDMMGQTMDMTMSWHGERVGDCP